MTCPVCGDAQPCETFVARERMFALAGPFTYAECAGCGSLYQTAPPDLAAYYPPAYHAFADQRPGRMRRFAARILRSRLYGTWRRIIKSVTPPPARDAAILDVGCGSGELLRALAERGYRDVMGADPFAAPSARADANGIRIAGETIETLNGTWDLIMFNHALEHVPDPRASIAAALARLRSRESTLLIRIPIAGALWKRYGIDWVQLDAPRHTFVPTERGLRQMIGDLGGSVERAVYDASAFGFWASEHYRAGGTLTTILRSLPRTIAYQIYGALRYGRRVRELNRAGDGDQAAFIVRRTS